MPTYYTSQLEKHWDIKKWISQELVRMLGICIELRDESRDLSPKEILDVISKESTYNKDRLAEAQELLLKYEKMNFSEWKTMLAEKKKKIEETWQEHVKEIDLKSVNYKLALKELMDFAENNKTESINCIVNAALQQLGLVRNEFEYSSYLNPEYLPIMQQTANQFKKETINEIKKDIIYNQRQIDEEKQWIDSRVKAYKEILEACQVSFEEEKVK